MVSSFSIVVGIVCYSTCTCNTLSLAGYHVEGHCKTAGVCRCQFENGYEIDLSNLSSTTGPLYVITPMHVR